MTKHFLRTCLSLVLCLVMLAVTAGAVSSGSITTKTAVNIRTGAGTSNSIIATVPAGTVLISGGQTNGWYKVVYNGTVGYVSGDYVTASNTASGSFGTGTVVASAVNLRSGAGTNTSVIATLNKGATMSVVGVSGEWYQVNYNGTTGYINSAYVGLSGSSTPAPSQGGTTPASGTAGSVKGNSVRMRSGAGTSYSILGTYNNGTALTILGTENGWTKVTLGGVTGYIRSDYVNVGSAGGSTTPTTATTGYINGTSVRMRAGASTTSQILGTYNTGTAMTITGSSGNWYAVTYNGRNGYVCKDYMTTTQPSQGGTTPASGTAGTVKGNYVRLRSGAGTNYSILGTYNNGTPLTITGTSGSWTAVTINGKSGYMSSTYVSVGSTPVANGGTQNSANPAGGNTAATTGAVIVETAKKYLGYPYVYGGMSPAGFDCSGFVNYVYKLNGYSMNRVASAIYYNNGTYVDKANLQPGDLVFFSNSSESVGHVGIYIGNNQMIHASTSKTGVIISDLGSSYYIQHYVGAKRIIT
ncbi:MAG: SH3 domain-containing protein [Oscillospiraceae bacterium]|nr:SH3 domain-containing protein [Oscillospiraceae bacterium]